MKTLTQLAAGLAAGAITARALIEDSLARIADPNGEGARAFTKVHADSARACADAMDALRKAGRALGPYAGIPVAFKDLTDIAGEATPAGSRVLADASPAQVHAPVAARMFAHGFVSIGRTNMTEFAYSGLGLNPHYGTPAAAWERDVAPRVPGGSSSGTGVAVGDGIVPVGLGTDTGGSCRIPAACNNIVGFKPTARRVPLTGILPLAPSLDSVGPLARCVADCAVVDAVFAGEDPGVPQAAPLAGLRVGVPKNYVRDDIDQTVARGFDRALTALSLAGARVVEFGFDELSEIPALGAGGGLVAAESYHWHRALLAAKRDGYDPRVSSRILAGEKIGAADYLETVARRAALIARSDERTDAFDVIALPTIPVVPPRIADLLADDEAYRMANLLLLRNPTIANLLDRCALALPCGEAGGAPVSLMLMGKRMEDRRLLAIGLSVEEMLGAR